jgi:8-amino-7-oxononanoate synthase
MPDHGPWDRWAGEQLEGVQAAGRYRHLRPLQGVGPRFRTTERSVVSFASNDYLGLASHPEVARACGDAAKQWGTGTGSSRLLVGDRVLHHDLERSLAEWKGQPSALLFPSGYHANLAVLTTFAGPGTRIVSDELNHASIIDGARLSRAEVCVYRHDDLDQARSFVEGASGRVVLVSDSVFSMDGDVAPVAALSELAARSGALLVLDDAHAVFDLPALDPEAATVRVGTLSKTLGAQGGFAAAPAPFTDLMINRARSFIFTTGLAPPVVAAASAGLGILVSPEGDALRCRLRQLIDAVAEHHPSPIVPVLIGSEADALTAADRLLSAGLLVPAIRPPTVPPGTSRLRISLSAAHTDDDLARLTAALATL